MQISPGAARALLEYCKWNKERLFELYFSAAQDKLFEDAHVVNPHRNPTKKVKRQVRNAASSSLSLLSIIARDWEYLTVTQNSGNSQKACEICFDMYNLDVTRSP